MIITPNAVVSGVVSALVGNDYTVYKETMTKPKYPHCFVENPSTTVVKQGRLFQFNHFISLQYRENAEPSTVGDIHKRLETNALKIVMATDSILADGQKLYAHDVTCEKVDGILQVNMTFIVKAKASEVDDEFMRTLQIYEN